MRKGYARISAVCLAAGLLFANSAVVYADETAGGDTAETEDVAGTLGFAECDEEFYVNVRTEPSTDTGEVIGILKNHDSAEIESVEADGWYKIKSGDVEGYVAAWLIKTGDEADAIASEVAYNYAINHAVSLNVRSTADEGSDVVTALDEGAEAEIVADEGNWFKVALDADTYGYVSKDYVEEKTAYPTGETIDQMNEEAEAEAASSEAETAPAETAPAETEAVSYEQTEAPAADQTYETEAPQTEAQVYETAPETEAAVAETEVPQTEAPAPQTEAPQTEASAPAASAPAPSATGASVVAYASQFVGNSYVWGGSSLTGGADCSGFTMAVFSNFGVSLPHSAASQLYCGTQVSLDSLAPGDLVFYNNGGSGIDHVAIYAGGGSIVHAANSASGICYGSLYGMTPVAACRVV